MQTEPSLTMTLPESIRRFRLGIFNPCANSPYGFQRLFYGFGTMQREDARLELVLPPPNHDPHTYGQLLVNVFLMQVDALLIVNPRGPAELSLLTHARRLGVPVWVDWGDDIFAVRPSNPSESAYFDTDKIREIVSAVMVAADVATVATNAMREVWPGRERCVVLADECRLEISQRPRRKIISWRGMSSHAEDIESVLPEWERLVADPELKDWTHLLMGDPPLKLVERLAIAAGEDYKKVRVGMGERVINAPFMETVTEFYHLWEGFAPFLHIVPLADNQFNRGKSPNAWLECAGIGAAVIAPSHLPEWSRPGVIRYCGDREAGLDFETVVRREIRSWTPRKVETEKPERETGELHREVATMRAEVYPAWTTAARNRQRWAILRKLATALDGGAAEVAPVESGGAA